MATATKVPDVAGYSSRVQKVLLLGEDNQSPASGSNPIPTTAQGAVVVNLDDYTTSNVTYVGTAIVGSVTSDAVWQVKKLDETTGLVMTYADGNSTADNVWDDRASLSYS